MAKAIYDVPIHGSSPRDLYSADDVKPFVVPSTTPVFLIPPGAAILNSYTLAEVQVQRIPTKPGAMRLAYPLGEEMATWFEAKLVPIARAHTGQRVFMFLEPGTARSLVIGAPNGHGRTHTAKSIRRSSSRPDGWWIDYECNEQTKFSALEGHDFVRFENAVPTCPDCSEATWQVFYVCSYEIFKDVRARTEKAKKVTTQRDKKFLARPTRFDRVVDEVPTKVRAPVSLAPPEIDEPVGRDAKLDARFRAAELDREKREAFKRERRWK